MTSPFGLCIGAILGLGLLGLPIGYSMIAGSILYLLLAGLDLGTYNSYVLLAVPLFLFSAELMNVSNMTDQLLRFCDMLVGRFRGGLGHINIVQSIIFAGMSGSAIADLAATGRISIDMMTRNNRYPLSYAAAITAASAVSVRRLSVSRRGHSWPTDGARANGDQHHDGAPAQLSG
jgi:C4-dicarboxylate transporter, DctM subunit